MEQGQFKKKKISVLNFVMFGQPVVAVLRERNSGANLYYINLYQFISIYKLYQFIL